MNNVSSMKIKGEKLNGDQQPPQTALARIRKLVYRSNGMMIKSSSMPLKEEDMVVHIQHPFSIQDISTNVDSDDPSPVNSKRAENICQKLKEMMPQKDQLQIRQSFQLTNNIDKVHSPKILYKQNIELKNPLIQPPKKPIDNKQIQQQNQHKFEQKRAMSKKQKKAKQIGKTLSKNSTSDDTDLNSMTTKKLESIVLPLINTNSDQFYPQENLNPYSSITDEIPLTAKYFTIYEAETKKIIFSKRGKKVREIASLTKIMTCYICCQRLDKKQFEKNMMVRVSKMSASMIGTSANLITGDHLTLWDLLHALMLPSGNDAAFAIAEHVGRIIYFESEEYKKRLEENPTYFENCKIKDALKCFIHEMNRHAKDLNMHNSRFANPHGLMNKANKSCANDICKLAAHAMRTSDTFREIVKIQEHAAVIRGKNGILREVLWQNTNRLLERSDCNGIKTGVTPSAGPCLCTSFRRQGKWFIIVVLKCENLNDRFVESELIYEWICNKMGLTQGEIISKIPKLEDINKNTQEMKNYQSSEMANYKTGQDELFNFQNEQINNFININDIQSCDENFLIKHQKRTCEDIIFN